MSYRSGTYIAFDGLGKDDPSQSDFKYYATIQAWDSHKNIVFSITNSHEKTAAVRDTSKLTTLKARIQERLRCSKNILVILSADTRKYGSLLSYEIEQAVDNYNLPLIIAYAGYKTVQNVNNFATFWPNNLSQRIGNNTAKAIHVPFKKAPIFDAISQFIVDKKYPKGGAKGHYSDDAYKNWGLL